MKIFVLERLLKQTHKNSFSKIVLNQIYDEIENLKNAAELGHNSLRNYLNKNNGKELKGTEHIWKFRLNDGDRILYTWGKYLPYIKDKESLVLVAYASHNRQDNYTKLPEEQNYKEAYKLIQDKNNLTDQDIKDLCDDDYEAFVTTIFENNYHDSHTIYVVDDIALQKADISEFDIMLSSEQQDIIDQYNKEPIQTLILGGAGTGKTILALHLLNDRVVSDFSKYAYFTQSRELLNKVKNQYNVITNKTDIENVNFFDINEYCRNILKRKKSDFIETPQFLYFVRNDREINNLLKKIELTEFDLWTEIRGVIKGLTNSKWKRSKYQNQQNYLGNDIKELENNGFIKRKETEPKLFRLSPKYETLNKYKLTPSALNCLSRIIEYYDSFDTSVVDLLEEEYINLSDELTMAEKEKRKDVYSIYLKYKKWLQDYKYYDDNDLARETIEIFQKTEFEKFDFIIIDEIQDYTEIQIYLISKLVIHEKFLVFAGDTHQIINPTVFDERRLYNLFTERKMEIRSLGKNFRCQKKVVDLGNEVARIRREKIASKKHETPEVSERDGDTPKILTYNKENIKKLISYLLDYPNVAILVPEETVKKELIKIIGEDIYENSSSKRIYTIAEIKGMEYKYVVSYNMLSTYSKFWNLIMNEESAAKTTRFRYYFNLFYVAITRSFQYICLIEKDSNNPFLNELRDKVEFYQVPEFNKYKLSLNYLTNENIDWLNDAKENESVGNYQEAKESYKKAGSEIENIWRCEAELSVNRRDFESALKYYILLDEYKKVELYFKEIETESSIKKVAKYYLLPQEFLKSNGMKRDSLINWVNEIFTNNEEEKYKFLYNILNKLQIEYIKGINK